MSYLIDWFSADVKQNANKINWALCTNVLRVQGQYILCTVSSKLFYFDDFINRETTTNAQQLGVGNLLSYNRIVSSNNHLLKRESIYSEIKCSSTRKEKSCMHWKLPVVSLINCKCHRHLANILKLKIEIVYVNVRSGNIKTKIFFDFSVIDLNIIILL